MKEYKAYNGYYIGTGANNFKSKEEIDAFHLERAKKLMNRLADSSINTELWRQANTPANKC